MLKIIQKNIIPCSIIAAGLLVVAGLVFINKDKINWSFLKTGITSNQIGEKSIAFINENIPGAQEGASLVSVINKGSIYEIALKIAGQEYKSYATKDGKFFFPEGYEMTTKESEPTSVDVPKTDKPDVKLFIMTYCPFGLQAQKMYIPVYNLLKDKADMGVYFVSYIMHEKQEMDENIRQYCIQKEQKDKYADYLSCFTKSGDYAECFGSSGIDIGRNENCFFETDKTYNITNKYNDKSTWIGGNYPVFPINTNLNEEYGVQGSPTVVINGKIVEIDPRSPEKFKEIICQAFNSQPEECSQTLSSDVPSSGIGTGTGASGGSCE